MTDLVNHPQHYAEHYDHEVIELTQHLSFCLGNAVKYILRALSFWTCKRRNGMFGAW